MSVMTFIDRVRKHFGYLEANYGYRITNQRNSEIRPETDGMVEYTSDTTVLVIDSDTGSAAIWFYRIKDGKKYDLDPVAIHEFLNTNNEEKQLLLSTDSKDQSAASALSNRKFLLNQPGWTTNALQPQDKLETRLRNYADWLTRHAHLCLTGDFVRWADFYEYKIQRARADYLRRGKDEMVYARVKDPDGKYKLIKHPAFQAELEHIEKLKKEFAK